MIDIQETAAVIAKSNFFTATFVNTLVKPCQTTSSLSKHREKAHFHPLQEKMAYVDILHAKLKAINNLAALIISREVLGSIQSDVKCGRYHSIIFARRALAGEPEKSESKAMFARETKYHPDTWDETRGYLSKYFLSIFVVITWFSFLYGLRQILASVKGRDASLLVSTLGWRPCWSRYNRHLF